ncbi:TPA: NUDIX hydrolase [Methanosarcina acetivorans]|jgi:8-oxo-dGTP diphosphatase|uniref:ADP-ribose pyrophosphatase n=2 Tax=Methanosarcina acetivorans TaxID=2214 RepID=Q8TUF4_METAC|nr:NUDIX hydrolase [Methanosarcina acetivorans]AAM03567.1 ADP-ribose pyrophosphatase [Methanosarcina acetivorans C2A]HIH95082.1 NUDIX hydrolase [Methanosarcina acetivorans]
MKHNTPSLTVDAVILFKNKLVLVKRKNPPYQGKFALPGGFVEIGESTEEAASREAFEETGLSVEILKLIGVYSDPERDPRRHTVSVCYLAKGYGDLKSGSDADAAELFEFDSVPELAFDHNKMINDAKSDINAILYQM